MFCGFRVFLSVHDWIHLVEGNQSRAPELVEAISREIEREWATLLPILILA